MPQLPETLSMIGIVLLVGCFSRFPSSSLDNFPRDEIGCKLSSKQVPYINDKC